MKIVPLILFRCVGWLRLKFSWVVVRLCLKHSDTLVQNCKTVTEFFRNYPSTFFTLGQSVTYTVFTNLKEILVFTMTSWFVYNWEFAQLFVSERTTEIESIEIMCNLSSATISTKIYSQFYLCVILIFCVFKTEFTIAKKSRSMIMFWKSWW